MLTAAATAGLIGLVVGVARGIIGQRHGGLLPFLRGLVASVLVSVLVGWSLADSGLSTTKVAAIVGVCAYLADDILAALIDLAKLFSADPFGFVSRVWSAIRGAK